MKQYLLYIVVLLALGVVAVGIIEVINTFGLLTNEIVSALFGMTLGVVAIIIAMRIVYWR